MDFQGLAQKFIGEHNKTGDCASFDWNEKAAIQLFATWLDINFPQKRRGPAGWRGPIFGLVLEFGRHGVFGSHCFEHERSNRSQTITRDIVA